MSLPTPSPRENEHPSSPQKASGAKKPASLPGKLIIKLGRFVWTTLWHLMMSKLAPRNQSGEYVRPSSEFRNSIGPEPGSYPPAAGRYSLFVGFGCPWAHRTLVVRALKGLEDTISLSVASPAPEEGGWVLNEQEEGCRTLAELYQLAKPGYQGRCTVPELSDKQTQAIVNNESAEIIVMLSQFNEYAKHPQLNLCTQRNCEKRF